MEEQIETFAPIVTLTIAVWAGFNTIITFVKYVNELRDTIISGRRNGSKIEIEHLRIIFWNDWLPLSFFGPLICFTFSAIVIFVAFSIRDGLFRILGCAVAIPPLLGGVAMVFASISDGFLLKRYLSKN